MIGLADLGNRFRLVSNEIETVPPDEPLPKLPVARAVWRAKPDLRTSTTAWLTAGGPHHTVYTSAVSSDTLHDFALISGVELVHIDDTTKLHRAREELRWNAAWHHLCTAP